MMTPAPKNIFSSSNHAEVGSTVILNSLFFAVSLESAGFAVSVGFVESAGFVVSAAVAASAATAYVEGTAMVRRRPNLCRLEEGEVHVALGMLLEIAQQQFEVLGGGVQVVVEFGGIDEPAGGTLG